MIMQLLLYWKYTYSIPLSFHSSVYSSIIS